MDFDLSDFLQTERLEHLKHSKRPRIAAVGTMANVVLTSPLLRESLEAYGLRPQSFKAYDGLSELVAATDWDLCLVLSPCKLAAYEYVKQHLTPTAAQTKVVDTLLRTDAGLVGVNTNAYALAGAVTQLMGDKTPKKVLVAGAGATARSAVVGLHTRFPGATIAVIGRSVEKARALVQDLRLGQAVTSAADFDAGLIINATTVGQTNDDEGLSFELPLHSGVYFFDVNVRQTYLQRDALAEGCMVSSGAPMQIAANHLRALVLTGGRV